MVVNYSKTVVLAPHGSARREVTLNEIDIPDLWHLAKALKKLGPKYLLKYPDRDDGRQLINGEACSKAVLEVWHLAHDLKKNLASDTEPKE